MICVLCWSPALHSKHQPWFVYVCVCVCVPVIRPISRLTVMDAASPSRIQHISEHTPSETDDSRFSPSEPKRCADTGKLHEQLTTAQKLLFSSEQLSNLWYLVSFYTSLFPSAQGWLCQSLRHLCCVVYIYSSFSLFLSLWVFFFFFFWLLAELGMHPVFLRNHQNQMWSLYAVEKAVWAAGLGHVLHACDKKYRHNAKVELTMYCVAVSGEDRAVSLTRTDRCWFTLNSSPPPPPTSPSSLSPLRLHHRLKNSSTRCDDYTFSWMDIIFPNAIPF